MVADFRFVASVARELDGAGWRRVVLPAGVTLAGLRAAGVPFKGDKYFATQAADAEEHTTVATEVAYRPGLLPGSLNREFNEAMALLDDASEHLPAGVRAVAAPAAACIWLFVEAYRATGAYPVAQCYTWTTDRHRGYLHLVAGAFGQGRPFVVAPLPEGRGSGVGVWPIIVPEEVVPRLWPAAESRF